MHCMACPLLHLHLKGVAPNWQQFFNPFVSTNPFTVHGLCSDMHSSVTATDILFWTDTERPMQCTYALFSYGHRHLVLNGYGTSNAMHIRINTLAPLTASTHLADVWYGRAQSSSAWHYVAFLPHRIAIFMYECCFILDNSHFRTTSQKQWCWHA